MLCRGFVFKFQWPKHASRSGRRAAYRRVLQGYVYMHGFAGIYSWYTFMESRAAFCLLSKRVDYSPVVEWGERTVGFIIQR